MTHRARGLLNYATASLWLALGCGQAAKPSPSLGETGGSAGAQIDGSGGTVEVGGKGNSTQGGASSGRAGAATGGTSDQTEGGAGNAGAGGASTTDPVCGTDELSVTKRVVRLSSAQLSVSLHALFGSALGEQIDAKYLLGSKSPAPRTFPPLASASEGSTIIPKLWEDATAIAADVALYTQANLSAVTGCDAAPSDACARDFIGTFAERVFRRPPSTAELASFFQVYDEALAVTASNADALVTTVEALLQSPQFLYRTELGDDSSQAGELQPFELASALSYFLTDGPPDAPLLDSAATGALSGSTELAAQATRILEMPGARFNFEQAMLSYFAIERLETTVIDDPAFTAGLRDSAYIEIERLFASTMWTHPFWDILTSRQSAVNQTLASFYGVTLPPPPQVESVFVQTELPRERAGLLTRVGFLAGHSRPDGPSVVARGLTVNAALLCVTNPPFPTTVVPPDALPANATERQKAEYRASQESCGECHKQFDAYGLALDTYDAIGRYRSVDSQGRPIDPQVTLPPILNGALAKDAVDMEAQIAKSPAFARCLSKNMLLWALAEMTPLTKDTCDVRRLADAFTANNGSFSALLREIALSPAFHRRAAGTQ
jgi:hypothetical protein